MDDMTLFMIGGLVTFLFVGGVLQANLYRALRSPEESEEPERKRSSSERAPRPEAKDLDASGLDPMTAWQTEAAIASARKSQSLEDGTQPEQSELH